MRLLVITKCFVPGPEHGKTRGLQMEKLVRALGRNGCELAIVAGVPKAAGFGQEFAASDSTAVSYVPYDSGPAEGVPDKLWRLAFGQLSPRWIRAAAAQARILAKRTPPDVVFTSSTPIDSHLAGLSFIRSCATPWLASFSDPYPPSILPPPYRPAKRLSLAAAGRVLDLRNVRRTLTRASAVHMFSRHGLELMERKMGVSVRTKGRIIPHIGTDLFAGIRSGQGAAPAEQGKWLVHLGELTPERCSTPLLEAIAEVASACPARFKGLLCIGDIAPQFKALVAARGWQKHIDCLPWMHPSEFPANLPGKTGGLLIVEADMPESPFIPSKFADYACMRKPILALTPPVSAARDYLERYPDAGIAAGHNRDEIAGAIRSLFGISDDRFRGRCDSSLAELFDADHVAGKYIRVFEELRRANEQTGESP